MTIFAEQETLDVISQHFERQYGHLTLAQLHEVLPKYFEKLCPGVQRVVSNAVLTYATKVIHTHSQPEAFEAFFSQLVDLVHTNGKQARNQMQLLIARLYLASDPQIKNWIWQQARSIVANEFKERQLALRRLPSL